LGIHDLWLFIVAGLVLNITPGPDMALIMARSTQEGVRAGVAAALGIGTGALVHIAASAIGISAILLASAAAFTALKVLGALYLIAIGVRMLWGSERAAAARRSERTAETPLGTVFAQGFLTNILNPKVAIFFLAFLPQFIDAGSPSKVQAFITLGLCFDILGTLWNLAVAWSCARLAAATWFPRLQAWLERALGVAFVALGVRLAVSER
jgi:RhtB (resistance to homoserine/threonine) family protein